MLVQLHMTDGRIRPVVSSDLLEAKFVKPQFIYNRLRLYILNTNIKGKTQYNDHNSIYNNEI